MLKNYERMLAGTLPSKDVPATHYNTLGEMRTEYLFLNDEWFVKSFGWQLMNKPPAFHTPIGMIEPLRIYKDSDFPRIPEKVKYVAKEVDYGYGKGNWMGD